MRWRGAGPLIFGGGLNVLLSIIKHPPHFLYVIGWAGVVIGAAMLAYQGVHWFRHRHDREEEPKASERPRRYGYIGREGSKGNLPGARFGKGLDVGIDSAGEVDAPDAEFGIEDDDEQDEWATR